MQKKVALRRFGVVAGLTAGLIGIGGVSASAFADSPNTGDAIIGAKVCPPGYVGVVVTFNGNDASVCTNI